MWSWKEPQAGGSLMSSKSGCPASRAKRGRLFQYRRKQQANKRIFLGLYIPQLKEKSQKTRARFGRWSRAGVTCHQRSSSGVLLGKRSTQSMVLSPSTLPGCFAGVVSVRVKLKPASTGTWYPCLFAIAWPSFQSCFFRCYHGSIGRSSKR